MAERCIALRERRCAKVEAEQALAARELKRQRAMLEDLKVKYTKELDSFEVEKENLRRREKECDAAFADLVAAGRSPMWGGKNV
jgi:hypothetical protein